MYLKDSKIIVIKIGSSLLIDNNKKIRKKWLFEFSKDIRDLIKQNKKVIIVSSGAIAMGCKKLNLSKKTLKLDKSQAVASIGQIELMNLFSETFVKSRINISQILLTLEDTEQRRRALNAKRTFDNLFQLGFVPIVNENDSIATSEIKYGDNDRLASRVAQISGADSLVLLSDVDGLYSQNPKMRKDFFNEVDMNRYATPLSSAYTSDETIIAGSPLIASGAGKIEGYFEIPDYTAPGQKNVPKFATGKIQFKLTTSDINQRAGVAGQRSDATSAGSTLYEAVGTINTEEITIVSTRNAEVVYDSVSSSTVVYGGGVQTDQIIAYAQVAPTYSGDDGPTSSGVTGVGGFSDDQAASDVGGGTGTGQSGNDGDSDDAGGSDTGDDTDDDGDNDDS